jgi:choline monooxygenase
MTSIGPHTNLPLEVVTQRLRAAAERPFDTAVPIPPEVHHSQSFAEHERERIFTKEWICVGRADEVANHGDYLTHEVAGVPIVVVGQADGTVKGFVNACAHRFSQLVSDEKGARKRFTCPYHAWTYECDGSLIRAPHMDGQQGFDRAEHGLRKVSTAVWEGFLYVTLSNSPATSLEDALAPLRDNVVGRYDMGGYRTVMRHSMVWEANWKNLVENFTESYHVPVVHRNTFAGHQKPIEDYVCGEDSDYYGYHYAPQASEEGLGAAHPANNRLEGEWRRTMVDFCTFPSLLVTLMPDFLWYITVQPCGTGQMAATWGVAFPPEVLDEHQGPGYEQWLVDFKQYIDVANDEDKPLVQGLHKGTASDHLPVGALHPIERNLWQFTRYLARLCY